jgi:hypothetical protein
VANFRVIGPYFFEDEDGCAVTSARYVETLRNFLAPELGRLGTELTTIWFRQDGATARTARASMEIVREIFPEQVISLRGDLPWPARSPDLSGSDYFVSECFKAKECTTRPETIAGNIAIRKQISAIPENMERQALGNLRARLDECVRNGGQHLSDVLFKTK